MRSRQVIVRESSSNLLVAVLSFLLALPLAAFFLLWQCLRVLGMLLSAFLMLGLVGLGLAIVGEIFGWKVAVMVAAGLLIALTIRVFGDEW